MLYEAEDTASFSNDTPFSGSLIGMAVNRLFSKLKSKLDIARLMIYRRRLEGEYVAAILCTLAKNGVSEKDIENGALENKAQAEKFEKIGDDNRGQQKWQEAYDAYEKAIGFYMTLNTQEEKPEYKEKITSIEAKMKECKDKLGAPIEDTNDENVDDNEESKEEPKEEEKTELEKLFASINQNNTEISDAIKGLDANNINKNYTLFVHYLYFKKWEEKIEVYDILSEYIKSIYSDVKTGTFKENLGDKKKSILGEIIINLDIIKSVNEVINQLAEKMNISKSKDIHVMSGDIEEVNKLFNIQLSVDFYNKFNSNEFKTKMNNVSSTLKEWYSVQDRIKKEYDNVKNPTPVQEPKKETQEEPVAAQETFGESYKYTSNENVNEGFVLFGKAFHPFGKRYAGEILGDNDLKEKFPTLKLKLLNDKKIFNLFQKNPDWKKQATEAVNKDNVIAIETLARRYYEIPENDYGRRMNLVTTQHDKNKILYKWKELIAKVKGMYKNYINADEVDPILLYNALDSARKGNRFEINASKPNGGDPTGTPVDNDDSTLKNLVGNQQLIACAKVLGINNETIQQTGMIGLLNCRTTDNPKMTFGMLAQFVKFNDCCAYKFIGLVDLEALISEIKVEDTPEQAKEKIKKYVYFSDSIESTKSGKILGPILRVLRTRKPKDVRAYATLMITYTKAVKSQTNNKSFLLLAVGEDNTLKAEQINKASTAANWYSELVDVNKVDMKSYENFIFKINITDTFTIDQTGFDMWDINHEKRNEETRLTNIKNKEKDITTIYNKKAKTK